MSPVSSVTGWVLVRAIFYLAFSVFEAFQGSSFKMEVTDSTLVVKSKLLKVSLSLPVSDAYLDVSELLSVAGSSVKEKGTLLKMRRQDLLDFMDSCKAVATKERLELSAKAKAKKLNLQVKSVLGNVKQSLALLDSVNAAEFRVDFVYLEEAVRKSSSEDVTLKVIGDSSLLVGTDRGATVVSLNE